MRRARVILATGAVLVALAFTLAVSALTRGWWYRPDPVRFPTIGIDVSHHNGVIDWQRVASTEVRFAYIKATEGRDWEDDRFAENWEGARRAGLATGAYHFFSFCSPGAAQAEHFLSALPTTGQMLPPALDVEFGRSCKPVPALSTVHDEILTWLRLVEASVGAKPVIYLTPEAFEALFKPTEFEGISGEGAARLWYRSVLKEPRLRYPMDWTFWQYHPRGRVAGIEGPVDLNAFAQDAHKLPLVR